MAYFVPRACLNFDLQALIAKSINDWSTNQPLDFTRPVVESCGDFIAAEMDAKGLRQWIGEDVVFNNQATESDYAACVFAGLENWLITVEISTVRTREEMEEYWRQCGE